MDAELLQSLARCETDVDGALRRLAGNEDIYLSCLDCFLQDQTISELNTAINAKMWDEAFTAAHAMKGMAGNMGFVPLFHATGELVVLIRAGRLREVGEANVKVNHCYNAITSAIRQNRNTERVG